MDTDLFKQSSVTAEAIDQSVNRSNHNTGLSNRSSHNYIHPITEEDGKSSRNSNSFKDARDTGDVVRRKSF